MTTDFLSAIVVMLGAALCCGWVTRELGMTEVAGQLLAGALLGPTLLGHVWPGFEHQLLPKSVMPSVGLFALLIVLVYVAEIGSEIDARVFDVRGTKPVLIVAGSTLIAVLSAVLVQQSFPSLVPRHVSTIAFTLFVAAALLITAVPVLARILDETGLTRTYVGGWALAIAVYVDFVAFTIAATATPLAKSHVSAAVLEGPAVLLGTLALCYLLAPVVARIRRPERRVAVEIAVLVLALAAASATNASTLVAAFIVGAVLWRRVAAGRGSSRASTVVVRALVPVYIVYSGFQVNLRALTHPNLLLAVTVVLLVAVGGKLLASLLAARVLNFNRYQARTLAVLGNTRGLTELILISLGRSTGILSADAYSILFLMTLVTTAASGLLAGIVVRDAAHARRAPFEATIGMPGRVDARGISGGSS